MPIYKDEKVTIPVTTLAAFFSSPLCTAATIPQDLLESLQQVLYYIDGNPATVPPANLNLTTTPAPQLTKIYQNGFAPAGISVTGTSSPGYSIVVIDSTKIDAGALSAGLYMVVMFHLTKQLQLITKGTITTNTTLSSNTSEIAKQAIIADTSQPVIYQALKQVLLDNGFQLPKKASEKIAFNDLMMPNIAFGGKGDTTSTTTIKGKLFTYMVKVPFTTPPANLLPDEDHFKFKDPNVMNVYKNKANNGASGSDLTFYLQDEYNKVLLKIFTEWNVQKNLIIQQLVKCLFNSIIPGKELPDGMILASGNGSFSQGILCKNNYGLLFLEYDFELQTNGSRNSETVSSQKIKSFKSPTAGSRTVVHLDVFGLDDDSSYLAVKVGKYGCYFIASTSPTIGNGSVPTPFDPTGATFNIMNPDFPTTLAFVKSPLPGIYYFVDKASAPYTIIATYNTALQELVFTSDGSDVQITSYSGTEEVGVIAVVVKDTAEQFSFVVENLFNDDRFELTTSQKDTVFLQPATDYDAKLDKLVDILKAASPTVVPVVFLNGAFVGKQVPGSSSPGTSGVMADPDYTLFRSTTVKKEDYLPPAVGSDNETLYPKLRYSFGTVTYSSTYLEIRIESYVSPLRSRLDKRLLGPNLDGTGTPTDPANPFDYRDYTTVNLPRFNTDLQPQTWYGANSSTDAYLLLNESLPFNSSTNPKIASYNQLLSTLRCFGILEALAYRINARAALQGTTIATNVATNLLTLRNNAVCETIKISGIPTNAPLYAINTTYEDLKWYTSAADQLLY
ncbi:MAG: hypothetical protein JWP12_3278 [Bacteroidetes bacterium]|nr:hypothetical protein [Bacteroidota bacterium]